MSLHYRLQLLYHSLQFALPGSGLPVDSLELFLLFDSLKLLLLFLTLVLDRFQLCLDRLPLLKRIGLGLSELVDLLDSFLYGCGRMMLFDVRQFPLDFPELNGQLFTLFFLAAELVA